MVPNRQADTMNRPSPSNSARYSGQCSRSARPMLAPVLLKELGHKPGPAGLVAGAEAGASLAVEVLVEEDEVLPVRIRLERLEAAVHRPASVGTAEEDRGQAPRQFGGHV